MGPLGSYGRVYRKRGRLRRLLGLFGRAQRAAKPSNTASGYAGRDGGSTGTQAASDAQLGQLGQLPFTKPLTSRDWREAPTQVHRLDPEPAHEMHARDPWVYDYPKGDHETLFTYDGFGAPIPRRSRPLSSQWRQGGPGQDS